MQTDTVDAANSKKKRWRNSNQIIKKQIVNYKTFFQENYCFTALNSKNALQTQYRMEIVH